MIRTVRVAKTITTYNAVPEMFICDMCLREIGVGEGYMPTERFEAVTIEFRNRDYSPRNPSPTICRTIHMCGVCIDRVVSAGKTHQTDEERGERS